MPEKVRKVQVYKCLDRHALQGASSFVFRALPLLLQAPDSSPSIEHAAAVSSQQSDRSHASNRFPAMPVHDDFFLLMSSVRRQRPLSVCLPSSAGDGYCIYIYGRIVRSARDFFVRASITMQALRHCSFSRRRRGVRPKQLPLRQRLGLSNNVMSADDRPFTVSDTGHDRGCC